MRLLHARADRLDPRPAGAEGGSGPDHGPGDSRGARGQPLPLHRLREDHRRRAPRRRADGACRMTRTVVERCAIATMDAAGTEHADGHLVIDGDRLVAVGAGSAPEELARGATRRIDGAGRLATPGLVNCHHHLYQWATRGLAQQATLFEWLTELYPVWAHVDDEIEWSAARAGLAALALSGCTTSTDHHYVFPAGAGDLLEVEVRAAESVGLRFHPCRGSMDLGRSDGGLPPTRSSRTATRSSPPARPRSTASTTRSRARWCGSRSRRARRSP